MDLAKNLKSVEHGVVGDTNNSALGPFAKGYEGKLSELEIRRRIEFILTAIFLKYLDLAKN